jgi:hypothetical protein
MFWEKGLLAYLRGVCSITWAEQSPIETIHIKIVHSQFGGGEEFLNRVL